MKNETDDNTLSSIPINCIVVEDEHHAVKHLEHQLKLSGHNINILERLDSVDTTVNWLEHNHADLIFLDIELADGLSFEIFDHIQIKTPVIFVTSYNQYITRAFDINSISYLLKPVNLDQLKAALNKFHLLYDTDAEDTTLNDKIVPLNQGYQKRFLVHSGATMKPISVEEVAYFHVQNKRFLTITTKDKKQHILNSTLEILEQRLDPEKFFRVNRQFIISIDAIIQMHRMGKGRIKVEMQPDCKDEVIISADRAVEFRNWLNL